MADLDLDELERMEKAATRSPMEAVQRVDGRWELRSHHDDCAEGIRVWDEDEIRLLAALRNAAPALLAAAREGARYKELLAERVKRCACRGTGVVEVPCDFCDDSTYDHDCNDRKAPCSDLGCIAARAALGKKTARSPFDLNGDLVGPDCNCTEGNLDPECTHSQKENKNGNR